VLQVYEHLVPLQVGADAFVGVQTSPQALQSWIVLSPEHVWSGHCVCVHVQVPLLLSQVGVG
jgi:hypothetical protein